VAPVRVSVDVATTTAPTLRRPIVGRGPRVVPMNGRVGKTPALLGKAPALFVKAPALLGKESAHVVTMGDPSDAKVLRMALAGARRRPPVVVGPRGHPAVRVVPRRVVGRAPVAVPLSRGADDRRRAGHSSGVGLGRSRRHHERRDH
jgi:hypothetical protein